MVRANTVLRNAQHRARAGHSITYPAGPSEGLNPSNLVVLGVHDASFAQQPGGASQQGHIVFLALKETTSAKQGLVWALDWGSHKIQRVIRSTLASEAASASNTYDKVSYSRAIIAEIFFGWSSDWETHSRKIKAAMVRTANP